jgi:hypothetical protein
MVVTRLWLTVTAGVKLLLKLIIKLLTVLWNVCSMGRASHSNFEIKNKTIFDAFEMYDNTFLNYGRIASVQFRQSPCDRNFIQDDAKGIVRRVLSVLICRYYSNIVFWLFICLFISPPVFVSLCCTKIKRIFILNLLLFHSSQVRCESTFELLSTLWGTTGQNRGIVVPLQLSA